MTFGEMVEALSQFAETVAAWKRVATDASAAADANFPPADFRPSGFMQA